MLRWKSYVSTLLGVFILVQTTPVDLQVEKALSLTCAKENAPLPVHDPRNGVTSSAPTGPPLSAKVCTKTDVQLAQTDKSSLDLTQSHSITPRWQFSPIQVPAIVYERPLTALIHATITAPLLVRALRKILEWTLDGTIAGLIANPPPGWTWWIGKLRFMIGCRFFPLPLHVARHFLQIKIFEAERGLNTGKDKRVKQGKFIESVVAVRAYGRKLFSEKKESRTIAGPSGSTL
ncbi:MAG: hypothetical protein L6R40_007598 [Gallowayella cf. fulva]|nr:MAG: hypothetical protein L6R40_007598 [Xanthomendoza cf. fulva]